VEVEAGEALDWKALRWLHRRDTTMSTLEVNIILCREVQDRHIRARARQLAQENVMALQRHVPLILISDVNV
jgi:hypothetical protein